MKREVVLLGKAAQVAKDHLLRHYLEDENKRNFASRFGANPLALDESRRLSTNSKPRRTERSLHGNASFESHFLSRAIREAKRQGAGLAFLHSHPTSGWQGMSLDDEIAERESFHILPGSQNTRW